MDYRDAGVDIEEGYRAVLNGLGSFAGMFSLAPAIRAAGGMEEPVLVSGTDGVGTKLDIAFRLKKYDTVGIDCVAMCVNDVLCHGARPLFFLDYLACGKLDAEVAAALVKGVATGCRETGSVLLGGETAEMPGFYDAGTYDIAGFSVGIVDRKRIIDGSGIREGDALVGLASSGPHSNGFSLIRKLLPDLDEDFGGMPIGRALLEPTRLYVKPVLSLMEKIEIRGMAHITGGGFYENIPRMFPQGAGDASAVRGGGKADGAGTLGALADERDGASQGAKSGSGASGETARPGPVFDAVIRSGSWKIPPIFARLAAAAAETGLTGAAAQERGAELLASFPTGSSSPLETGSPQESRDSTLSARFFNTFNMGIGFVLALAQADVAAAIEHLDNAGFPAWEIGRVARAGGAGRGTVRFV
jgi:phosphoribosylformylglycinamidine cyclo-ligase